MTEVYQLNYEVKGVLALSRLAECSSESEALEEARWAAYSMYEVAAKQGRMISRQELMHELPQLSLEQLEGLYQKHIESKIIYSAIQKTSTLSTGGSYE